MDSLSSPFQRFLLEASVHLEEVGDLDKALKRALKLAREVFGSDEACLSVLPPGQRRATCYASLPTGARWQEIPFAEFLRGRRPRLSSKVLLARVDRRGRPWGVLVLRNRSRGFDKHAVRDMTRLGARLSRLVDRLDRLRLVEVRERIDRKMMEQLRPLDLFYQILHGLRSLTRYDHSAAVLIHDEGAQRLEVVAEQISWRKGASLRIGRQLQLDEAQHKLLLRGEVLGFDRVKERWIEWKGRGEGTQIVERVLELPELRPDLDVIFMTGAVHELDRQLIRSIRDKAFYFIQKPFDREVLLTLVDRCLEQRRLAEQNRSYVSRLEAELEAARAFQQSLLPPEVSRVGATAIAARYLPCEALGGDLYDYVDLGDGRTGLILADVSGHGVSAAMLTAIVKSAFHDARSEAWKPRAVIDRIAASLRPFDDDRFVTVFCARLDPVGGRLEYVNAAHPAPYLWSKGGRCAQLGITGPLVSPAFPDLGWDSRCLELCAGDRLLAYTDGITEARSESEFFGEGRLPELLAENSTDPAALLDRVFSAVEEFTQGRPADDDRTAAAAFVGAAGDE